MKFNCGPTRAERAERRYASDKKSAAQLRKWHRWFAVWPVRLDDKRCAWLEVVERRFAIADVDPWDGLYWCDPSYRSAMK